DRRLVPRRRRYPAVQSRHDDDSHDRLHRRLGGTLPVAPSGTPGRLDSPLNVPLALGTPGDVDIPLRRTTRVGHTRWDVGRGFGRATAVSTGRALERRRVRLPGDAPRSGGGSDRYSGG